MTAAFADTDTVDVDLNNDQEGLLLKYVWKAEKAKHTNSKDSQCQREWWSLHNDIGEIEAGRLGVVVRG